MASSRWLWFVPLGLGFACGGRFQQTPGQGDDDDDVTVTQAGTPSKGGGSASTSGKPAKGGRPSGTGGSTGSGGTSSGKAGASASGGAIGVGGTASSGGACFCDAIACGLDFIAVPNPDGCCFHCELDFMACEVDRQNYRSFRQAMAEKFSSYGCMTNADCGVFYDKTNCGSACGIPLPNAARAEFEMILYSYAQDTCSPACPHEPTPPCVPPPTPQCLKGRCF